MATLRCVFAVMALCLSASLASAEIARVAERELDRPAKPGRTGNSQMQRCLFDPSACPPDAKLKDPRPSPTRGEDASETPEEKLERFKQRFKCGEGGSGICVEDTN